MASVNSSRWGSLEQWSPTLFLVAGALLVAYAALHGLEAFMDMDYPILRDSVVRLAGYVIGLVALLGLYPSLADRSPKLVRVGAVFAVLGLVGRVVDGLAGTSRSLAVYMGIEPPAWVGAFALLILLGFFLGYPSFSVASLRTSVHSRTVGFVLLAPAAVMILNLAIVVAGYASPEGEFAVASGFALAHLAIGIALRAEDIPADRAEPDQTRWQGDRTLP